MAHADSRGGGGIVLEPLTREGFAPFGDVVSAALGAGRETNLGTARRVDWTTLLENTRANARPNLAIFRARPQSLPIRVAMLERHPHSTQVFAALRTARWLVIAAPHAADGGPETRGLRAFVAAQGDAVCLRRGLWHHPIIVLDEPAELLMLASEDGSPGDCEIRELAQPALVG